MLSHTVRVFKRLSFLQMFVIVISTSVFQFKKNPIFTLKTSSGVTPLRVSPGAVRTPRTPLGTPLIAITSAGNYKRK